MSFSAHSQIVRVLNACWKGNVSVAFSQVQLAVIAENEDDPCPRGWNSETLRARL